MWTLGGKTVRSRLLLGTSQYPSPKIMKEAVMASGTEILTVSLRRQSPAHASGNPFWEWVQSCHCYLLPNTAGCRTVQEAVTTAHLARELFDTDWIKLEVIGDEYTLQPDPFGTLEAARILCREGFQVFPYMTEDLILAERLLSVGCRILMPWGSPIGSGQGIAHPERLRTLRSRFPEVSLIVDAGIGRPSHAMEAMELGMDGVLLNTAVALAGDPVEMGKAFGDAVSAGRRAFEAGLMPKRDHAVASTPVVGLPFSEGA